MRRRCWQGLTDRSIASDKVELIEKCRSHQTGTLFSGVYLKGFVTGDPFADDIETILPEFLRGDVDAKA